MSALSPQQRARARSPEDAEALERFNRRFGLPLVLAALLPIILAPSGTYTTIAALVDIVAWLVFVVDFVVHERHLRHYTRTWLGRFDLSVVVLTAPWFLLVGPSDSKYIMLVRLARIARLAMASTGARRLFERLGRVAIVAAGVVVVASYVAYKAEHPTNPGFATYGDALWWGVVTLTTVGYGDIVPKTSTGRFAGVVIMFTGVAVLGLLAGSLASFFRLSTSGTPPPTDAADTSTAVALESSDHGALTSEVAGLRAQVARLADQVGRLAPESTAPPEPPEPLSPEG